MKFPRQVYAIQHLVTRKIYIGSSANVEQRYATHLSQLRKGTHPVEDFQQDYNEHGEQLRLAILDEIADKWELDKEYEWMDLYETYKRPYGYNYKDVQFTPQKHITRQANAPAYIERRELLDEIKGLVDRVISTEHLKLIASLLRSSFIRKHQP